MTLFFLFSSLRFVLVDCSSDRATERSLRFCATKVSWCKH